MYKKALVHTITPRQLIVTRNNTSMKVLVILNLNYVVSLIFKQNGIHAIPTITSK